MTPAARYQATIDLWDKISKARIPMDNICGDYFRVRRYIGSKDRADIAERVYNMMRAYARLGWWCKHTQLEDTARSRTLLCALLIDQRTSDDIQNLFNGNKYHPDSLHENEIKTIDSIKGHLDHPDMPESVQVECPEWAEERLRLLFGNDFGTAMRAMIPPATLDIRVNTIKSNRDHVQALLQAQNVESEPSPYSPVGLRLTSKAFLSRTKAFSKGLIEIQDEGSQLLGLICGAKPGMQVLDYCAGAGGKTLAMAATMEGKGRIVAMDIDEKRLMKAKPRLTKAGVHNFELRPIPDDKNKKWFKRQKGAFDIVLVDAPCSSSGTWRRNPDLRWNHYGPAHKEIETMQGEILNQVWQTVKPGGRLVYATCSLFVQENEAQIETFLAQNDQFKLIPSAQAWAESNLNDYAQCPVKNDYFRLNPHDHHTDGFFAAILERVSG